MTVPLPGALRSVGREATEVVASWRKFGAHADACREGCGLVARRCRLHPDADPDRLYESCCAAGQPLFSAWRMNVLLLRDELRKHYRR